MKWEKGSLWRKYEKFMEILVEASADEHLFRFGGPVSGFNSGKEALAISFPALCEEFRTALSNSGAGVWITLYKTRECGKNDWLLSAGVRNGVEIDSVSYDMHFLTHEHYLPKACKVIWDFLYEHAFELVGIWEQGQKKRESEPFREK